MEIKNSRLLKGLLFFFKSQWHSDMLCSRRGVPRLLHYFSPRPARRSFMAASSLSAAASGSNSTMK